MTDQQFYAAIAQQMAWLRARGLECIVYHRRFKPDIIIRKRHQERHQSIKNCCLSCKTHQKLFCNKINGLYGKIRIQSVLYCSTSVDGH